MKTKHVFGSFPIIYSAFMFYRSPQLADSLIVIALTALAGVIFYINKPQESIEKSSVDEIEQNYQLELAKAKLEQLKFDVSQQKTRRDEQIASGKDPKIFF